MNWLAKQEESYANGRIGHMVLMLTMQSCIGGISAMMSIHHGAWFWVSVTATLAMSSNAAFLANMKPKVCILTFYASVIINLAILFSWLIIGQ